MSSPTWNTGYRRATRNTPATTIVELCSSELTGVGPAIASGNHVCSGNWPDLPMQAMNSATAAHIRTLWLSNSPCGGHLVDRPDVERAEDPEQHRRTDQQADVADADGEERLERSPAVGLLPPTSARSA